MNGMVCVSFLFSHVPHIEYAGQLYNYKQGIRIILSCIKAQNKSVIVLSLIDYIHIYMELHISIVQCIIIKKRGFDVCERETSEHRVELGND